MPNIKLQTRLVGNISGNFIIPSYQRVTKESRLSDTSFPKLKQALTLPTVFL